MKRLYLGEPLATPEELAEYKRILDEIHKLEEELEKEHSSYRKVVRHEEGTIIGYLM